MSSSGANATAGVLAAIAAPFFMTLGFIVWDIEWKKAGGSAFALNMFKCNLASIAFLVMCGIAGFSIEEGADFDTGRDGKDVFTLQNVGFLMLSSCIGIIVGDSVWLESLRLLGATRVLVVDTIKPFVAAGLGRWVLGEQVHPFIFLGMVLTLSGVLLVSLEKERNNDAKMETPIDSKNPDEENNAQEIPDATKENIAKQQSSSDETNSIRKETTLSFFSRLRLRLPRHEISRGYLFAIMNILLDTYGSILTKQFGVGMTTWAINLIRFGFAGIVMIIVCLVFIAQSKLISTSDDLATYDATNELKTVSWYLLPQMGRKEWGKICLGVAFVTFICPALSNYALFQIAIALAITLGSLTPLYALILEKILRGKKATKRGISGAILAVSGVIVLGVFRS